MSCTKGNDKFLLSFSAACKRSHITYYSNKIPRMRNLFPMSRQCSPDKEISTFIKVKVVHFIKFAVV